MHQKNFGLFQIYLSLSRQRVSLQCAAAGGSSADHSGRMLSHSLGSHTDKASLLDTDMYNFKNVNKTPCRCKITVGVKGVIIK